MKRIHMEAPRLNTIENFRFVYPEIEEDDFLLGRTRTFQEDIILQEEEE